MRRVAVQGEIIQGSFSRTKVHGHLIRKEFHEGKFSGVSYIGKGGEGGGGLFREKCPREAKAQAGISWMGSNCLWGYCREGN